MVSTATSVSEKVPEQDLVLRICGSSRHGQIVRLRSGKCTVGSGPRCTLRLHAPGVRPLHCLILRGRQAAVVRRWAADTRLNGRTFGDAELVPGDRLTVGPIEFEVLHATLAPQEALAPAVGDGRPPTRPANRGETEGLRRRLTVVRRQGRRRARRLIEQLRTARRQLVELKDQHDRDPAESELADTGERLAAEAAELEAQRRDLEQQRQRWEAERDETQQRLQEQAGQLDARQSELEARQHALEEEHQRRDAELSETAGQLSERAEKADARQAELDARQAELDACRTELDARRTELDGRHTELDGRHAKLDDRQSEGDTRQSQLDDRQSELDGRQSELDARQSEWDARERELDTRQRELDARQSSLDAARENLRQERDRWDAERSEREKELAARAEELDACQAELEARLSAIEAQEERRQGGEASEEPVPDELPPQSDGPEEVCFEGPSADSPAGSEELFGRLGTLPLAPEDEPEEEGEPAVESPPDEQNVQSSVISPEPADDESIDDYMTRLLERVRSVTGGSSGPSEAGGERRRASAPSAKRGTGGPTGKPPAARPTRPKQRGPLELLPRAVAPEKITDLSAMNLTRGGCSPERSAARCW